MIKIYINRGRDATVKKVLAFLDSYQISYSFIGGKTLCREDLKKMLSLTELGFEEILVSVDRARRVYSKVSFDFEHATTEQLLSYILENQDLLRTPIVFSDKCLSVGYDQEGLRAFLPKLKRKLRV